MNGYSKIEGQSYAVSIEKLFKDEVYRAYLNI